MENRRLGQSDRGGGTKKKRRAHHLIGLTLAGCVALGVSSCSAPAESDEHAARVEQKVTGPESHVAYGATGVVDFSYTIEGFPISCTGSMIAPHVVLTAARCILPLALFGIREHEMDIHYYDPKSGRRRVHEGPANWYAYPSWLRSTLATGILKEANRAKNNPKRWRQLVHAALANWFAHPGSQEAGNFGYTAKDDFAVIVVPQAFGSLNSPTTDYHDYLRLYMGDKDLLQKGEQLAYGAGWYDDSHGDDQLRYGGFQAAAQDGYLKLEGREGGNGLKMCRGDQGGPFEYNVTVGGQSVPMIAAVWSNYNFDVNGQKNCANETQKGHDDSYAGLIAYSDHVQWIESVTGLSCASQSGGSQPYKRCFELPFIEDVPGEGLYEPNVATAIAMSAISVLW